MPHLAHGDYGDVLRRLKIVITKDSNVVCVAEAVACIGALGKVTQNYRRSARLHKASNIVIAVCSIMAAS